MPLQIETEIEIKELTIVPSSISVSIWMIYFTIIILFISTFAPLSRR